jgi:hypothetical protein
MRALSDISGLQREETEKCVIRLKEKLKNRFNNIVYNKIKEGKSNLA